MGKWTSARWGVFDAVDLNAWRPRRSLLNPFASTPTFVVDAALVAAVLRDGMDATNQRDANGRTILANAFRLVLHPDDFEELMRLRRLLQDQIGPVLVSHAATRRALLVDAPVATFVPDESGTLTRGKASLTCEIKDAPASGQAGREVTMRFAAVDPSGGPTTTRVTDGPVAALLSWTGGQQTLHQGIRYAFGRPHDGAPSGFISLTGAPDVVSRTHAWVEVGAAGIRIGRIGQNPVRVENRPLAHGGDIELTLASARILLGESFEVLVERR